MPHNWQYNKKYKPIMTKPCVEETKYINSVSPKPILTMTKQRLSKWSLHTTKQKRPILGGALFGKLKSGFTTRGNVFIGLF